MYHLLLVWYVMIPCICGQTLTKEMVDEINKKQQMWKANWNPSAEEYFSTPEDSVKLPRKGELRGIVSIDDSRRPPRIPDYFDSRKEWDYCSCINEVPNKGPKCLNCWALATAATLSDRLCIKTKGKFDFQLSAEDLTTCCSDCFKRHDGCQGGFLSEAIKYTYHIGLVTGGHYGKWEGCMPYSDRLYRYMGQTLTCEHECTNLDYPYSHTADQYWGVHWSTIDPYNVIAMQSSIMAYGPILSTYRHYADFAYYSEGIYTPTTFAHPVRSSVTIIGWGCDNGDDYWIVRNVYGNRWGHMNGFFKVRRGENDGGIESEVYAPYYIWDIGARGARSQNGTIPPSVHTTSAPTHSNGSPSPNCVAATNLLVSIILILQLIIYH